MKDKETERSESLGGLRVQWSLTNGSSCVEPACTDEHLQAAVVA